MSIRDRLKGLLAGSDQGAEEPKGTSDLRRRLERLRSSGPPSQPGQKIRGPTVPIEELVDGREMSTPHGPAFVVEQRFDRTYLHGRLGLDTVAGIDTEILAVLGGDERLAGTGLSNAVFIDTETTGLAGGTGTYAFLVGIGYFEQDAFVVRLVFMRDLTEEPACMAIVSDSVERADAVVSFNGKTFDLPLLATRFSLNRRPFALSDLPHLDLLHPARRLYRDYLEDCRLGTLEREILGLQRQGDVPSAEVPDLYREYLRTRDGRVISSVLTHNTYDIVSLVTLTAHLVDAVSAGPELVNDPGVVLRSARLLRDRGRTGPAAERFRFALDRFGASDRLAAIESRWELAMVHKRAGEHAEAVEHLWALAELQPACPRNYEELAKIHEHRFRDLDTAAQIVQEAIEYLGAGEWLEHREDWLGRFQYRLARLQRRLGQAED